MQLATDRVEIAGLRAPHRASLQDKCEGRRKVRPQASLFLLFLSTLWSKNFYKKNLLLPVIPADWDVPMVRTWSPVLRAIALIVAMIFGCGVAIAEPDKASADYVMPGCRTAVLPITFSNTVETKEDVSRTALCFGIISGLSYIGQHFGACLPVGTTSQQAVSVVVQYIDGHPEKIHENFNSSAVEALREAWPCLDLAWRNLIDPRPIHRKVMQPEG